MNRVLLAVGLVVVLVASAAAAGCGGAAKPADTTGGSAAPAADPAALGQGGQTDSGGGAMADKTKTLLTVADIEKASGQTGVREIAKGSVGGANGDFNFATSDGKLLLMVRLGGVDYYDSMIKSGKAKDIPGLGDAAFAGPEGTPMLVMFKKGDTAVWLSTDIDVDASGNVMPRIPIDKLEALARIAAGRL